MPDMENVITHLQIIHTWAEFARERDLQFFAAKHLEDIAQWAEDALELLKEQQEQKEKWIRDIDLYIADAEDSAKNPAVRSAKGYAVGLSYGLNIAKEIIEGKRNHG